MANNVGSLISKQIKYRYGALSPHSLNIRFAKRRRQRNNESGDFLTVIDPAHRPAFPCLQSPEYPAGWPLPRFASQHPLPGAHTHVTDPSTFQSSRAAVHAAVPALAAGLNSKGRRFPPSVAICDWAAPICLAEKIKKPYAKLTPQCFTTPTKTLSFVRYLNVMS